MKIQFKIYDSEWNTKHPYSKVSHGKISNKKTRYCETKFIR